MGEEEKLIKAGELLREINRRRKVYTSAWGAVDDMSIGAKSRYEENLECAFLVVGAPAVDAVEVVHGRWLSLGEYARKIGANSENYAEGWVFCSECEQPMREIYGWAYCPNCGAKMVLEEPGK